MSYVLPYASRAASRGNGSISVRGAYKHDFETEPGHALGYLQSRGVMVGDSMQYALPYASRSTSRGNSSSLARKPSKYDLIAEPIRALDYLYSKGIIIFRFHLTATTTAPNETVAIARLTTYQNTTIDWGDGTTPDTLVANNTNTLTHAYATAGTYPITVNHAHLITQLRLDNVKIGGLDTAELKYSVLTYFWITLITNSKINSTDMVNWRPTNWYLYSMPSGGTYSISSADMVNWRRRTGISTRCLRAQDHHIPLWIAACETGLRYQF